MSEAQIEATTLLCRLLERSDLQINGKALFEGDWAPGARPLLKAKLLALGNPLDYVTCTECWIESARVVREISDTQIRLFCPECEAVDAPKYVRDTYTPIPARLVTKLLVGLGLAATGMKAFDKDGGYQEMLWRLGTTQPTRGKPVTWYFGRMLHRAEIALRLREQMAADNTIQSTIVLTSSEVPLPPGSPLTGFDVRSLFMVGQIEEHSFTFFADRFEAPGPQLLEEAKPGTTLQYVKPQGKVFINGEAIKLEPRERKLLIALIDDLDHELDNDSLRDKVGSVAENFSPSKVFDRKPHVYRTFIRFLREDGRYQLQIPPEDRSWLI